MDGEQAESQKRALRAELRERRQNMSQRERDLATVGFTEQLTALATEIGARSMSCYLPTPVEPDVRPFLDWAELHGIRVLFPISREDGLLDWTVGETHDQAEGLFGVPEAIGELLGPIAINDVDLIVVPAAAIDQSGMRLGWGRGYFDKTLGSMENAPPVYAVVFDTEYLQSVPRELHDQPVNGVITPTRTLSF